MSALLGLALLTSPFVTLPPPADVGVPALVALGSDPARLRLFCWSTRCGDAEWRRALGPSIRLFAGGDAARRPVLRGALEIAHALGPRAQWNQRIQFETGHGMTFVKQSLGLDVALWPSWTLESDFQIRHDEMGLSGSESAESSLRLRRRF